MLKTFEMSTLLLFFVRIKDLLLLQFFFCYNDNNNSRVRNNVLLMHLE